jgi:hypothetical protein
MSRGRRQHHSPQYGDERLEGQYEKDPWRPDLPPEPPSREQGESSGSGPPPPYQRSDQRLREDISVRLMEAPYIDSSDVTVEVWGAQVVLEGTVPDRRMKHAIEDLVDACPGVQDIENRVRVRR